MALIHPTQDTFDTQVRQAQRPVLVDFSANWCPPCQALKRVLTQLADELDGRVDVAVTDVDQEPGLASDFNVSSIPALRLIVGGQVVAERAGFADRRELTQWIDAHAAAPQ